MSAFEELYRQYYSQVYFYILGLCRDEHIAEEITQETFFKALKKIDAFRGECKINVWLTQIAKNTFYNHCRRRKMETGRALEAAAMEEIADEGLALEEKIADREMAGRIYSILHNLSEPYREVFGMRTFGELTFREIANIYGKTESWARVTYYRAKLTIRKQVFEEEVK